MYRRRAPDGQPGCPPFAVFRCSRCCAPACPAVHASPALAQDWDASWDDDPAVEETWDEPEDEWTSPRSRSSRTRDWMPRTTERRLGAGGARGRGPAAGQDADRRRQGRDAAHQRQGGDPAQRAGAREGDHRRREPDRRQAVQVGRRPRRPRGPRLRLLGRRQLPADPDRPAPRRRSSAAPSPAGASPAPAAGSRSTPTRATSTWRSPACGSTRAPRATTAAARASAGARSPASGAATACATCRPLEDLRKSLFFVIRT